MAISPVVMQPGFVLANSAQIVYTTPANVRAIVKRATFTNVDTVTRTFTVYRVPSLGSPLTNNTIISAQTLSPGEDYSPISLSGLTLNPGETIQAMADASGVVNFFMSGFVSS